MPGMQGMPQLQPQGDPGTTVTESSWSMSYSLSSPNSSSNATLENVTEISTSTTNSNGTVSETTTIVENSTSTSPNLTFSNASDTLNASDDKNGTEFIAALKVGSHMFQNRTFDVLDVIKAQFQAMETWATSLFTH